MAGAAVTGAPIIGTWAALSHKQSINGTRPALAPSWVPDDEQTRLSAYTLLQAYVDNCARFYLEPSTTSGWEDPRDRRREYGDAALLVDQALAALLGEEQAIVVDGADDVAELPTDATAEDRALQVEAAAALERQDWFRDWAEAEMFWRKLASVERKSVALGDGAYQLTWDSARQRVRVNTWNPGFYFPVLDPMSSADDYPERVHLAYEFKSDQAIKEADRLRRITYTLGPLPDGELSRRYAWTEPGEPPSAVTCYMTDAVWDISDLHGTMSDTLSLDRATFGTTTDAGGETVDVRELDLRIDFLPIVHIPNTGDTEEHYGRSMLLKVAQILDDLSSTDSDLQAAAATTGSPPLVLHSMPPGAVAAAGPSLIDRARGMVNLPPRADLGANDQVTPGPGAKINVGSGKADFLDTSKSLDALLKLQDSLLSRMSVNSRMPESVLGRTEISGQLAGVTLALSFGPLRSLVREMRQVRDEKYPLLLRMVQRMAMAGGALEPGPALSARIAFGSYLPTDLSQLVELVTKLLHARAISRLTAVMMLADGGMPVDDAAAEVRRIGAEDFEGADKLADVDLEAARAYLDLAPSGAGVPPAIILGEA